jgi:hypothetical protein
MPHFIPEMPLRLPAMLFHLFVEALNKFAHGLNIHVKMSRLSRPKTIMRTSTAAPDDCPARKLKKDIFHFAGLPGNRF